MWTLTNKIKTFRMLKAINPLLILTIGSLAFMVVSLGLNIAILIAYKRRASEVYASLDERSVANSRRTEHRLTIYAAFTFLGHFLGSLYEVSRFSQMFAIFLHGCCPKCNFGVLILWDKLLQKGSVIKMKLNFKNCN